VVGIAIWVAWMAGLVALAGLSANPITLNRGQFAGANLVIIGNVVDVPTGRVKVLATKLGSFSGKELTVVDLAGVPRVSAGAAYVMPLRQAGQEYHVVSVTDDERGRVVYPATNEVKSQLADVLRDTAKRVKP